MNTTFELDYYYEGFLPPDTTKVLEEALNVLYSIDYIKLCIEFNVTLYVPAYTTGLPEDCYPAEGGELEILSIYPMYLTTTEDDIPVTIHRREREIIGDYIDEKVIEKECWKRFEHDITWNIHND